MNETQAKILGISVDQKTQNIVTNVSVILNIIFIVDIIMSFMLGKGLFDMLGGLFGSDEDDE